MKVINFGSINTDFVYQIPHLVQPGETISSNRLFKYAGGKGLNQSIALARAGAQVVHCGAIGKDGVWLKKILEQENVNADGIKVFDETPTGHAIIQVAENGENSIIIHGGANKNISPELAESLLNNAEPGDILLLQNEISSISAIMEIAAAKSLKIFFNAAPITDEVKSYPLNLVDTLIVNETEALALAEAMPQNANILKTLGSRGAIYNNGIFVPANKVDHIVDTTAAGDTFIGYFIAEIINGHDIQTAMTTATKASAICITRPGAAPSIPFASEL